MHFILPHRSFSLYSLLSKQYVQIYLSGYIVMLDYAADAFRLVRSKIGRRIGILVFIQIFFIVISLVILSYYQSQMTYLGNSIILQVKTDFLLLILCLVQQNIL